MFGTAFATVQISYYQQVLSFKYGDKRAVRRNMDRFPASFLFELTKTEIKDWRSQFVTSKSEKLTAKDKSARKGAGWLFDENLVSWRETNL